MSLVLLNASAASIPLADESVHCVVTSPPYYGLRRYSGDQAQVWGGDPDCAHDWVYKKRTGISGGTASKKVRIKGTINFQILPPTTNARCCICGAWYGELGLEDTPEQYVDNIVAVFKEVWRVCRPDCTVWLNISDSYNGSGGAGGDYNKGGLKEGQPRYPGRNVASLKPKDLCLVPARVALALQTVGWYVRSDIVWSKKNCMPEPVRDRPTKAHEYVFLLTKKAKYYYDAEAIKEPVAKSTISRNKYPHHGNKNKAGQYAMTRDRQPGEQGDVLRGRSRRTVWSLSTKPYKGAHFATMPPTLAEICLKAGTSERGYCCLCGMPWVRVVSRSGQLPLDESEGETQGRYKASGQPATDTARRKQLSGAKQARWKKENPDMFFGFRPSCDCYVDFYISDFPQARNPRKRHQRWVSGDWLERVTKLPGKDHWLTDRAVVLDPFTGSGTTLLVARQLGHHGVGLDLSMDYLTKQAKSRLSLGALDAWTSGKAKKGDNGKGKVEELPMFGGL